MVVTGEWLIDKSALVRLGASPDAELWRGRVERGLVRVATVTLLEVGYSARSGDDWGRLLGGPPVTWLVEEPMTPVAERRAKEVQGMLASRGHHRAPSVPDLLIAALAEDAGLILLHLDKDFELIARLSGQRLEQLRVSG